MEYHTKNRVRDRFGNRFLTGGEPLLLAETAFHSCVTYHLWPPKNVLSRMAHGWLNDLVATPMRVRKLTTCAHAQGRVFRLRTNAEMKKLHMVV